MANLLQSLAVTMLVFCFLPLALSRIHLEITGIIPYAGEENPSFPAFAPAPAPAPAPAEAMYSLLPLPATSGSLPTDQQQHQTGFLSRLKAFLKKTFHVKQEAAENDQNLTHEHPASDPTTPPESYVAVPSSASSEEMPPMSGADYHGDGASKQNDDSEKAVMEDGGR